MTSTMLRNSRRFIYHCRRHLHSFFSSEKSNNIGSSNEELRLCNQGKERVVWCTYSCGLGHMIWNICMPEPGSMVSLSFFLSFFLFFFISWFLYLSFPDVSHPVHLGSMLSRSPHSSQLFYFLQAIII